MSDAPKKHAPKNDAGEFAYVVERSSPLRNRGEPVRCIEWAWSLPDARARFRYTREPHVHIKVWRASPHDVADLSGSGEEQHQ